MLQRSFFKVARTSVWITTAILVLAAPITTHAASCSVDTTGPFSTSVKLSEFLPNPSTTESNDEFIELYNSGDEAVDLTGWIIQDASGTDYVLSGSIGAGRYLTWYRSDTKISLNNSGDSVTLVQPDGKTVETVSYADNADDDLSYARNSQGNWAWTNQPTPYTANQFAASDQTDSGSAEAGEGDSGTTHGYEYSEAVALSELLPDPEGSDATDEWVELVNTGEIINLYGWKLTDGSSDYEFPDTTLNPGQYLQLSVVVSGVSLNNSGETIQLLNPDGAVVSEVTYSDADSGVSYAQVNGTWQWTTTLTPAAANIISETGADDAADRGDTTSETDADEGATTGATTIAAVRQLASGTEVTFAGTVLVLPGSFSSTYFYVQDDTAGIQVASSTQAFPTLAVGDVVTITGKTSSSNGEVKVNVTSADSLVVTNHLDSITSHTVTTLEAASAGQLVSLVVTVSAKSGSTVTTDKGEVYLKRGTDISSSTFAVGQTYTVTGVVVATDDGVQLWPRSSADIVTGTTSLAAAFNEAVLPAAEASTGEGATYQAANATVTNHSTQWWLWVAVVAVVVVAFSQLVKLGLRQPWLRIRLRNWIAAQGPLWVRLFGRWVELEKSTTGSNGQNQYRESHTSDKTTVSTNPLNLPSATAYVPTLNPRAITDQTPVGITIHSQNTP